MLHGSLSRCTLRIATEKVRTVRTLHSRCTVVFQRKRRESGPGGKHGRFVVLLPRPHRTHSPRFRVQPVFESSSAFSGIESSVGGRTHGAHTFPLLLFMRQNHQPTSLPCDGPLLRHSETPSSKPPLFVLPATQKKTNPQPIGPSFHWVLSLAALLFDLLSQRTDSLHQSPWVRPSTDCSLRS